IARERSNLTKRAPGAEYSSEPLVSSVTDPFGLWRHQYAANIANTSILPTDYQGEVSLLAGILRPKNVRMTQKSKSFQQSKSFERCFGTFWPFAPKHERQHTDKKSPPHDSARV